MLDTSLLSLSLLVSPPRSLFHLCVSFSSLETHTQSHKHCGLSHDRTRWNKAQGQHAGGKKKKTCEMESKLGRIRIERDRGHAENKDNLADDSRLDRLFNDKFAALLEATISLTKLHFPVSSAFTATLVLSRFVGRPAAHGRRSSLSNITNQNVCSRKSSLFG